MKLLYCACFLLLFGLVRPDAASFREKVKRLEQECQNDKAFYVDEEELERFRNHEPTTATNIGAHYLCVNIKIGIQDERGNIIVEGVKNNLHELINGLAKINIIAHRCSSRVPNESAEESAITLYRCLHNPSNTNYTHSFTHTHTRSKRKTKRVQAHKFCQGDEKTRVNEEDMEKFKRGEEVNVSKLKPHLFCINKKLDMQDVDGTINKKGVKKYLESKVKNETRVKELTKKCSEILVDVSAEDIAVLLYTCVREDLLPQLHRRPSAHELCQTDEYTRIEEGEMEKFKRGEDTDISKMKPHVFCINKKLHIQNVDGTVNTDGIKNFLELKMTNNTRINEITTKCSNLTVEVSSEDTAVKLYKCVLEDLQVHLRKHHTAHQLCQTDEHTKIDEGDLEKFKKGEDIDLSKLKSHILCINKKLDMQNVDGSVNEDGIKKYLHLKIHDETKANELTKKCSQILVDVSAEDSAVKLYKCVREDHPRNIRHRDNTLYKRQQEFKLAHEQCQADPKTAVSEKSLHKARKGKHVDTPSLRAYTFCMNVKLNLQSIDGNIKTETIRTDLENQTNEAAIKLVVEKCGVRDESDPANLTALKLYKCLHKYERKREHRRESFLNRVAQFKKYHQECVSDPANQVSEDILAKFRRGEQVDHLNLGPYVLCINKKSKYQDKKGNIKKQNIIDDLKMVLDDEAEIERILQECLAQANGTGIRDNAVKLTRCVFKYTAAAQAAQKILISADDRR